jgi:CubicO group peptidase (beta-lactamase class C family)
MKKINQFHSMLLPGALICAFCLSSLAAYSQKKSPKGTGVFGKASYHLTNTGQYMRDWLIAGPFLVTKGETPPDEQAQASHFNSDNIALFKPGQNKKLTPLQVNGETLDWTPHSSNEDVIDLDKLYNKDFASAYALAEITSTEEKKIFIAFGSDDGIKVFLNGKEVHKNWIPRGITPDDDLVEITIPKGSSQLVVKVQDIQGGWGFTARIMDRNALSEKLIVAARKGNLDETKLLLESGADVNLKNKAGLTPFSASRMYGRAEVSKLLKEKGALDIAVPSPEILTDNEYSSIKDTKSAGISLLVARDGKVIYSKGFGYADIAANQPVTPDTKFRIGSITKQFIGAAILKLQEEGRISVQDKLSKYIPDFPRGTEITIHHLLTHTSGIHSYTNKNDFISRVTSPIAEDALVEEIKKGSYDFDPGERFLYNNSGYFLLGHIIRKVTGKSYGEYLRENFFNPLGMTNTGVHEASLTLTNEAKGYKKENGEYKSDINWDMTWAGGAGSLYSTTGDLFKWNEALFNGKLLKPESLKAAFTPVTLNDGKIPVEGKYGYGWFIENYRDQEAIGHGGGLHGFSTRITRFPKENLTVVMLTNVIPTEVTLNPNTVAEFFIWDKLGAQASYSVNEAVTENVKQYEGRYNFAGAGVMTITSEDNKLFAQLTGQSKFPIFAAGPGEYFWRVVDARIKFIKNEKGEVTHGEFSQNGNQLTVTKLKDDVIVTIDPGLLEFYVGKYDMGDNNKVTITKENNKLYAQTQTSPKFEVKPLSNTEFTIQELNARLIFIRDGTDKAAKFILDMAGQKKELPRVE